jgi:hypothetical protein
MKSGEETFKIKETGRTLKDIEEEILFLHV